MVKALTLLFCAWLAGISCQKLGLYSFDLYQKGRASESWVPVEAYADKFEYRRMSKQTSNIQNPHFDVVYQYNYEDVEYIGDVTGFGPYSKGQLKRPDRHGKITVHVNPSSPEESVYVKGVSKPNIGAMAVAAGLGVVSVLCAFFGLRLIFRWVIK